MLYLGTTTTSTGSSPHVWTLCTLAPRIVTAAADICHSLAVTQDGTVNSWGKARQSHMPTGLGYADMQDKLVPARVAPHHMQGARVGRCHSLPLHYALAFGMSTC